MDPFLSLLIGFVFGFFLSLVVGRRRRQKIPQILKDKDTIEAIGALFDIIDRRIVHPPMPPPRHPQAPAEKEDDPPCVIV